MSATAPQTTNLPQPSTAPHQALYRRWRAQTFAEIVGQTAVVETLRNAVRAGRVSHAVLFVGPRGTGKTSLARILAKALNCTNLQDGDPCDRCEACVSIREGRALDLVEIDAASNRGIDAIRDLRERIQYTPTDLRRKVYILDEAHQITKDAWNALLKSLEEPPEFVAFMFASTHPQEFPPAILSRLQRYDVRRLTVSEIEGKLARILAAESVEAEPTAIHLIARLAAGGMRDAESMLDQVLSSSGGRIDDASVRDLLGLAEADAVDRLVRSMVDGDAGAGLAVLSELDDRGRDVGVVLDQVVEQLRAELGSAIGTGDHLRAATLSSAAHRLAAIDPERRGVGGLRFQLELALLDTATRAAPTNADLVTTARPARPDRSAQPASPVGSSRPDTAASRSNRPTPEPPPPPESVPPSPRGRSGVAAAPAIRATGDATAPTEDGETTTAPAAGPALSTPARATVPIEPLAAAPEGRGRTAAPAEGRPPPRKRPAPPEAENEQAADIDRLRSSWTEVVATLSQSPVIKPLIVACRPVSVEGTVVTLGFPEDQGFLKDALDRRRSVLEDGIGRVLGRAVSVRCVATNLDDVPPPAEAADLISEARRIFADDLADVGEIS